MGKDQAMESSGFLLEGFHQGLTLCIFKSSLYLSLGNKRKKSKSRYGRLVRSPRKKLTREKSSELGFCTVFESLEIKLNFVCKSNSFYS